MARKIKIEELQALIEKEEYIHVEGTTLTVCVLHLTHGFTVTGTSGTIDPSGYDEAIGKTTAYNDAFNQLWKLEGYYRTRFIYECLFETFESIGAKFNDYVGE
jgi:hypothetical protein